MRRARIFVSTSVLFFGATFFLLLAPQAVEARTQPNNSFEATAKDSCSDPSRTNRVFGTSWANNDGTVFGDTVTVNAQDNTVTASFYSSAFLCSDAGTRNNIELINISDSSGRVTYSSSSIWRANSATAGNFAGPDTSQQPMTITINVSHITSSGTYTFPYTATYRDSNGTGASASRSLVVQVDYQVPPTPPQSSASAACVSASGSINLDYTGSASVRFKAWLEGDAEPAGWQQERWFTNGYGESRSYSFTIPNTAKDAYRNTQVRIRHMYSPRSENNHDAFNGSVGLCGDSYSYQPSITGISNPDSAGNRKPGQTFAVSSQVANQGVNRSGTARRGPNYLYTLHIRSGGSYIAQTNPSQSLSYSRFGLFEGTTDTLPNRSFVINSDAPHGAEVCFEVEVSPAEGQTWPTSGARTTVQSRTSGVECFIIYNQQFELDNITLSGDTNFVTPPPGGAAMDLRVRVFNNGNINSPPAPINNSGAVGGTSSGVTTTLQIYRRTSPAASWDLIHTETSSTQVSRGATGTETISYTMNIPQNTPENTTYRFCYQANPTSGWSDGSTWGGAPFNNVPQQIGTLDREECADETRVTTQSYFQVHRNDIHSGVSFATDASPLRGCEGINPAVGFIDAARTNSYGSLSEYAAYATGVIPTGTTRGFGSSATSTGSSLAASNFFTSSPMNTRLTFGNTPTLGNLGGDAYRCMSNLFELLEKSDVPQVSGTVNNFAGGLASPASEDVQVYAPSGLRLATSGNNGLTTRRVTIIVNGDLFIDEDIRNYTPGGQYQNGNVTLIVRGNINIHRRVERIDALLYAIPDASGNGGALDTCYNHTLLGTDVCGNQLTINGVVVADRLDLKRTHGGISGGRTQAPAEVFRFSPVHFFRSPYFIFSEEAPRPDLPIQQMSDLPPRF